MIELTEALIDDAMIVVIDTSATPTISAAAVAEVRDGFRMALLLAQLCRLVPLHRQRGAQHPADRAGGERAEHRRRR